MKRLRELFAQPIPIVEVLRELPNVRDAETRRILLRSRRAFVNRVAAGLLSLVLLATLCAAAWYVYTSRDVYQIGRLIVDADQSFNRIKENPSPKHPWEWLVALVEARKSDAAIMAAGRIVYADAKAHAFIAIAKAQFRAGSLNMLNETWRNALLAVDSEAAGSRTSALADVAQAQSQCGDIAAALTILKRAESSLHEIDTVSSRIAWICDIAKRTARLGAQRVAETALEYAMISARQAGDSQDLVVSEIAETQAEIGQFIEAMKAANQLGDGSFRDCALCAIAQNLARVGDITQAITVASRIEHDSFCKTRALCAIAIIQIRSDRPEDSEPTWAEAIAYARQDSNTIALAYIVEARCNVTQFNDALELANEISGEYPKCERIAAIVLGQALAGHGAEALATAERITDSFYKSVALAYIVNSQAKAQNIAGATEVVKRITDTDIRSTALELISKAQARKGQAKEALETALAIPKIKSRAATLSLVLEVLANSGRMDELRLILDAAQSEYRDIEQRAHYDPKDAQYLRVTAAKGLAYLEDYRHARVTVAPCDDAERLTVYTIMLRQYAKRGHPEWELPEHEDFEEQAQELTTADIAENNDSHARRGTILIK